MIVVWTVLAVLIYFGGIVFLLSLAIAAKRGDQRGDG